MTTDEIYTKLQSQTSSISDVVSYSSKKTNNKTINISLGRLWFNSLLPDTFRFVNEPVNKNLMSVILTELINSTPVKECSEIITKIQTEAFKLSAILAQSFKIDCFLPSEKWLAQKQKLMNRVNELSPQEFEKEKEHLTDELFAELDPKNIGLINGLSAGISGKMSKKSISPLFIAKGITSDIEGNISVIPNSLNDGYTVKEYYDAAGEARKGQFYKSTAVRDPGYLSRKIVMANANINIDKSDCKSKKYLSMFISKDVFPFVSNRYYLNDKTNELELITSDSTRIIGQTIQLRSPLYCKSKSGICAICYGKLFEKLNTTEIGILAGGAINNVLINAMMKLRHKTSQVDYREVDFIKTIKQSSLTSYDFSKYLTIEKTKIIAKTPVEICFNNREYTEDSLIDSGDKYIIPGLLQCTYNGDGDNDDTVEEFILPIPFNVTLFKPENMTTRGSYTSLYYNSGELIVEKELYIKDVNPYMITKLFDGVIKYVKTPELLLDLLKDELPGIDLVHTELIISNIFRQSDDITKYARLNNYKNAVIVGCKQLPHVDSWISSLMFEDINKSIKTSLVNDRSANMNPLEKLAITSQT